MRYASLASTTGGSDDAVDVQPRINVRVDLDTYTNEDIPIYLDVDGKEELVELHAPTQARMNRTGARRVTPKTNVSRNDIPKNDATVRHAFVYILPF